VCIAPTPTLNVERARRFSLVETMPLLLSVHQRIPTQVRGNFGSRVISKQKTAGYHITTVSLRRVCLSFPIEAGPQKIWGIFGKSFVPLSLLNNNSRSSA
jgi:hypothetical protein